MKKATGEAIRKKTYKPKATEEDKKWQKFLDDNRHLVGLSHYDIKFCLEAEETDDFSTVEADIRDKTLKVRPSKLFFGKSEKEKREIMLHELVHGRILIYQLWEEKVTADLEEDLANDLTKGLASYRNIYG